MGQAMADGDSGMSIVQNCLFYKNPRYGYARWHYGESYLINCTFGDNSELEESAAIGAYGSTINMYNCISYNQHEVPLVISVGEWQLQATAHLNIYNSLIEGGEESIKVGFMCDHHDSVWCHVHYDPTNIDADPIFLGMWDHPYMIADGSPCINTGTLANLPDFIELPEFDLAGNPRIVGDSIDMGAYEWNSTIVGFNEIGPNANKKESLLKAWPNPFSWETTISINNHLGEKYEVEIYDNYGNLVKKIISTSIKGKEKILWNGADNNDYVLPAGIYHVVMFSGEREVESLKLIKK